MNKRAVFVTLTAVLIVVVLLVMVLARGRQESESGYDRATYLQHETIAEHARLLETSLMPVMLESAAKHALYGISAQVNRTHAPFTDLKIALNRSMMNGSYNGAVTDVTLPSLVASAQNTVTVPYTLEDLTLDVVDISHVSPTELEIIFDVNYTLLSETADIYQETDMLIGFDTRYTIEVSVYGLVSEHTGFPVTGHWQEDAAVDCYLKTIGAYDCAGIAGICPLVGC